jgi:hypothetical protein
VFNEGRLACSVWFGLVLKQKSLHLVGGKKLQVNGRKEFSLAIGAPA